MGKLIFSRLYRTLPVENQYSRLGQIILNVSALFILKREKGFCFYYEIKFGSLELKYKLVLLFHTCNPNYLRDWGWEDHGSSNSSQDPISKIIRAYLAQSVEHLLWKGWSPEFKQQSHTQIYWFQEQGKVFDYQNLWICWNPYVLWWFALLSFSIPPQFESGKTRAILVSCMGE
jgi:hypothetical protein